MTLYKIESTIKQGKKGLYKTTKKHLNLIQFLFLKNMFSL